MNLKNARVKVPCSIDKHFQEFIFCEIITVKPNVKVIAQNWQIIIVCLFWIKDLFKVTFHNEQSKEEKASSAFEGCGQTSVFETFETKIEKWKWEWSRRLFITTKYWDGHQHKNRGIW